MRTRRLNQSPEHTPHVRSPRNQARRNKPGFGTFFELVNVAGDRSDVPGYPDLDCEPTSRRRGASQPRELDELRRGS